MLVTVNAQWHRHVVLVPVPVLDDSGTHYAYAGIGMK